MPIYIGISFVGFVLFSLYVTIIHDVSVLKKGFSEFLGSEYTFSYISKRSKNVDTRSEIAEKASEVLEKILQRYGNILKENISQDIGSVLELSLSPIEEKKLRVLKMKYKKIAHAAKRLVCLDIKEFEVEIQKSE